MSDELHDLLEATVDRVIDAHHRAVEARIDELIAAGYRGTLFVWCGSVVAGAVTFHAATALPPDVSAERCERYEITDDAVAALLAHRRAAGH